MHIFLLQWPHFLFIFAIRERRVKINAMLSLEFKQKERLASNSQVF